MELFTDEENNFTVMEKYECKRQKQMYVDVQEIRLLSKISFFVIKLNFSFSYKSGTTSVKVDA